MTYLWIALGSALGGMARYWCGVQVADRFGIAFPWGTMTVNVLGSFLIGFVAALAMSEGRGLAYPAIQQFVIVGFCGGYTTFSTFSLQTLALIRDGHWLLAAANIAISVVACLLAVIFGHLAGTALVGPVSRS